MARTDTYADLQPPYERDLVPAGGGTFLEERPPGSDRWVTVTFATWADGTDYLHVGPLALRRRAAPVTPAPAFPR